MKSKKLMSNYTYMTFGIGINLASGKGVGLGTKGESPA